MSDSTARKARRSDRSNVLLRATLEVPGASLSVILRNLSQDGALVQSESLPGEGTRVLFHRQGLSVPCRVAWSHAGYAGLEFDFPLYPKEILRHIPMLERKAPVPMKRPGLASKKPLTPGERALIERWATEPANKLGE